MLSSSTLRIASGRQLSGVALAGLLAAFLLTGCDKRSSGETVGQQVGQAVDATVASTQQAADRIQSAVRENAPGVQAGAEQVGSALKATFDNAALTAKVTTSLHKEGVLSNSKIDVTSKDGVVTLAGSVADEAAKAKAVEVARSVNGVTSVVDQLVLAGG